jgi:hypothetical protein
MSIRLPTRPARRKAEPSEGDLGDPRNGAIAAARADVERLHRAELDLHDRRVALTEQIATARTSAGAAALEAALSASSGGGIGDPSHRVAALDAEIAATDAAITAARERRRLAILAVWAAEAAPLRERAARLRDEADARATRTGELLRQLEEWEGVRYVPAEPSRPNVAGDLQGGAPTVRIIPAPRTRQLQIEADDLERRAAALETRTVRDSGHVEAESAAALIQAIRTADPLTIAPTLATVEAWATEAEAQQRARIARQPSETQARCAVVLALAWRDGAIDARQSRAGVPALER